MSPLNKFLLEVKNKIKNLTKEYREQEGLGDFTSRLHQRITKLLPHHDEQTHLKVACISGLMARIAFADLKIEELEREIIQNSLSQWANLTTEESHAVSNLCIDEVRELAGIENHLYCLPLRELLTKDERYKIVISLFAVAAADGTVENHESEEIRNICHGLLLEHQHYISARATVLKHLGVLKS